MTKLGREALALARQLVRIHSYSGQERRIAEFVCNYFTANGIKARIDRNGNVIASVGAAGKHPVLLLNGHLDTVPVTQEELWDMPPFEGRIRNGFLYGRGSVDMKGALASMMVALKHFKAAATSQIIFTAVVCEESTTQKLRDKGIVSIISDGICNDVDYCIVGEPTGLNISIGHRGRLVLRLVGKPAHASMPNSGTNAISHSVRLISFLDSQIRDKFALDNRPDTHTLNIVRIEGGVADNVIPDRCCATMESRYLTATDERRTRRFIDKAVRDYLKNEANPDLRVNVELLARRTPSIVEGEAEKLFLRKVRNIVLRACQTSARLSRFYTDAGYIRELLKKPVLILGPGQEDQAHQRNERISIEQIDLATHIYYRLFQDLAAPEPV